VPTYRYWATTEIGDTVSGELSADSPDEAAHLLTLRGWVVRRMALAGSAEDAPGEPLPLGDDDFGYSSENWAPAAKANLPLTISLRALAEESPRYRTRRILLQVIDKLEQGQSIEEVFSRLEAAYPRRLSPLFEAGLKTGRLPQLMQHGLDQVRRTTALKRKVWFSLAYPCFLFVITFLVGCGILFGIVPQFARIFDDFGTQIPSLTAAIINISKIGWAAAFTVLGSLAAVVGILVLIVAASGGRTIWHRVVGWLPLIGGLFRAASLSGMFRMLSILVDCGFSLPEAFRIAAAVNDDATLYAGARKVAENLEQGENALEAVRDSEQFPREVLPIFRWADNRTLFVDALNGAADIYAARSQMNSSLLAVIFEPALIFGAGFCVAVIVVALFLPLIKLLNDLA